MYSLLLPPKVSDGRHIEGDQVPLRAGWSDRFHASWGMVLRFFASVRR